MVEIVQKLFLGIPIYRYGLFIVIIFSAFLINKIFNNVIIRLLKKWATKTRFEYDDLFIEAIYPPLSALILLTGFIFAFFSLNIPAEVIDISGFLSKTYPVAFSVIAVWIVYRLSDLLSFILRNFFAAGNQEIAIQFSDLFKQSLRILVVVIGGIMIVQNLGYSVSSLLTGLGIGGLAVALAAQDTLSNFFGTVVMLTDRPFQVGDWVQFGDVDGKVETIGFRSTRIRTWSQSLMIIPNKLLTSDIIQNWSAMPKRRVKMTIGITYDSPREKIQLLLERIRTLLKEDPDIDQESLLVNFTEFGASSLDILIYYFTRSTKYAEHLTIRERINFKIMQQVEELGLSFAFPSQTVYFGNQLEQKI
jgi:MscS family membrane protein